MPWHNDNTPASTVPDAPSLTGSFDRQTLRHALGRLGQDLAAEGAFVELAIYGGRAIMLQFEWRRSTDDVDAVVREGYDEALLRRAADRVALAMNLDRSWLNNAVGMFTPLLESDALFELSGCYPATGTPGLRVLVARPHYLLALKLKALANWDRGRRDLDDARALARHLGIAQGDELLELYRSIHGEAPSADATVRFASVLGPE